MTFNFSSFVHSDEQAVLPIFLQTYKNINSENFFEFSSQMVPIQ